MSDATAAEPAAFEVFVQLGSGRPLQYVGSVRGYDPVLAWQAAKEIYTRREECSALWVVPRESIVTAAPGEERLLAHGSSRRYRMPAFPSGRRRTRARAAERSLEDRP